MKIKRDILDGGWTDGQTAPPYPRKVASLLNSSVVFKFPDGIPAFETAKEFIILMNENIKPFLYLKCVNNEELGFICVDPFMVCREYSVKIPAKDLSLLELKDSLSALVLSMVTVDKDPKNTTTNLLAPIIINMDTLEGRQIIQEENYPVRYRIWEGIESIERTR